MQTAKFLNIVATVALIAAVLILFAPQPKAGEVCIDPYEMQQLQAEIERLKLELIQVRGY